MSALALLGYAAWTLSLLVGIAAFRCVLSLMRRRAANAFAPSGDDVSPFSGRLCRAHANCYENLPVFAALIVVALVTSNASVTDGLAPLVVVARVGQSVVHLLSTSVRAVTVRFGLFAIQVVVQIGWFARLLVALAG